MKVCEKWGFIYNVIVYDENENFVDVLGGFTLDNARVLANEINNGSENYPNCYAVVSKNKYPKSC